MPICSSPQAQLTRTLHGDPLSSLVVVFANNNSFSFLEPVKVCVVVIASPDPSLG